jgi:hypothetical protein
VTPAAYAPATLLEGRLEVGRDVRLEIGESTVRARVCETARCGERRPCAVVKTRADMRSVELQNVAPGKATRERRRS